MHLLYRDELLSMISSDSWMMEILRIVKGLKLNDCWVGAGFIRNKVWDVKHGYERTILNDIDILYFDLQACSENDDLKIEEYLNTHYGKWKWSVKNQARMHLRNEHPPYKNTENAIAYWPETATAVAARLSENNLIEILAPYGLNDLFSLYIRKSPLSTDTIFNARVKKKHWQTKWPRLTIIT
jgi:uncharacterized protein